MDYAKQMMIVLCINLDKHIILSRSEMTFYDFRNTF